MMPFDIRFLQNIFEFKISILQLFYHFNQYHYLTYSFLLVVCHWVVFVSFLTPFISILHVL